MEGREARRGEAIPKPFEGWKGQRDAEDAAVQPAEKSENGWLLERNMCARRSEVGEVRYKSSESEGCVEWNSTTGRVVKL